MTIQLAMTLDRKEDRGHDTVMSISLVPGMPDMIRIEDNKGKVEFTLPEARVISYTITEWLQMRGWITDRLSPKDDDDDDY